MSSSLHQQLLAAVAAHQRGQLDAAERGYRAILRVQPTHFDAMHLLGAALAARGQNAQAEPLLRRAVALNPKAAAAHNNLGNVVKALGRAEDSLAHYGRAIALDKTYADALGNRGNVLAELGRGAEALADYDGALAHNPGHRAALQRSAQILNEIGRPEEALMRSERALALGAGTPGAWMRNGNILLHLKRPDAALASYDKALALDPDHALCAVNRSAALDALGRPQEAIEGLDRVLARNPHDAGALNNKATILKSLDRPEEALAVYEKALALAPDDADIQSNFAMGCLLTGDFERGWPAFEQRWAKKENAGKKPVLPFAEWEGEPLGGRSIVVHAEQGLGDIVQFARFLPLLKDAKVTFLVAGKMHALLHRALPGIALLDDVAQARERAFDFQCAMMSLPLRLGTRLDTIPAAVPYLEAEPERMARWRERIGDAGFKIGIAWQGNPNVGVDQGRSIALSTFLPLAQVPGVRLISLQKNEGSEQLRPPVESLGEGFDAGPSSFLDTAAAMESFDLVISSDTAVAHVAGALARPVWIALKHVPDWRWMRARADSPWYPTMRLFRQTAPGDWDGVFVRIREALSARAASKSA